MLFTSPQEMDIHSAFRSCCRWGATLLPVVLFVPGGWPPRDRSGFRTGSFKFLALITQLCSAITTRRRIYVLIGLSSWCFAPIGSEPFVSHAHTWQWSNGRCHCWQGSGRGLSVVLTSLPSCNPDNHSRCRHHGRHSSWMPPQPAPLENLHNLTPSAQTLKV